MSQSQCLMIICKVYPYTLIKCDVGWQRCDGVHIYVHYIIIPLGIRITNGDKIHHNNKLLYWINFIIPATTTDGFVEMSLVATNYLPLAQLIKYKFQISRIVYTHISLVLSLWRICCDECDGVHKLESYCTVAAPNWVVRVFMSPNNGKTLLKQKVLKLSIYLVQFEFNTPFFYYPDNIFCRIKNCRPRLK